MKQSEIDRINELAKKAKEVGLTAAELEEQKQLRTAYVASIRSSLTAQLDNTYIRDANGTTRKLRKK